MDTQDKMRREIKFKVWDKDNKRWLLDSLVYKQLENQGRWNPELGEWFIIMQYTGLKDKNGKEIYEGSILQHPDGIRFQVVWDDSYLAFRAKYSDINHDITSGLLLQVGVDGLAIVIGNIYENKEILTNAKKENKD